MKTIKEIRDLFGLSWAIFSRTYHIPIHYSYKLYLLLHSKKSRHIPIHSLEDWESGRRKCPDYIPFLLERVVKEEIQKNQEMINNRF